MANASNFTEPGLVSEVLGHIAYSFSMIQPYLKTELLTILSALFPIFVGAHASLTRPPSAAKPTKKKHRQTAQTGGDTSDDEEDEGEIQRMEGFSKSDALYLPLFAGATLTGLYLLITYLKDLNVLNKVLSWYFSIVGVFSVCKLLGDGLLFVVRFVFPRYYKDSNGDIWEVKGGEKREAVNAFGANEADKNTKGTPLPGPLAHLPLPNTAVSALWTLRHLLLEDKLAVRFYARRFAAVRTNISIPHIIGTLFGLLATVYYNFIDKPWYLTNLMGFSFSYTALQLLSPTTFDTGSLILAALFVYDVIMVFYTPMMVTVAKNLDVPIKLVIPRGEKQFSMLGLGDVVLPGMMVALAIRFDLYLHYLRLQKSVPSASVNANSSDLANDKDGKLEVIRASYVPPGRHWSNQFWTSSPLSGLLSFRPAKQTILPKMGAFKKTYFYASIIGYVVGMITTLVVMITFQHPQPALLYLVPGVLISIWGTAVAKGEVNLMWQYTEEEAEDEHEQSKKDDQKAGQRENNGKEDKSTGKSTSSSFFSNAKLDRNAKKFEKHLGNLIDEEDSDYEHVEPNASTNVGKQPGKDQVTATPKKGGKASTRSASGELFHLSVSWYVPKDKRSGRKGEKINWASTEGITGGAEGDEHGRKRLRVE